MRIISGFLKGKPINFLKNSNTRPLKDSVKENIFNILKHSKEIYAKIENSKILDLYSGVGSFGIECISRNAKSITFVEQDRQAVNILKENLNKLKIDKKVTIFDYKIENFLKKKNKSKFDIFFLDPPFKDKNFTKILEIIKINKMYNLKHIVIIHRESKTEDDFGSYLSVIKTKSYGRSKIIFGIFN